MGRLAESPDEPMEVLHERLLADSHLHRAFVLRVTHETQASAAKVYYRQQPRWILMRERDDVALLAETNIKGAVAVWRHALDSVSAEAGDIEDARRSNTKPSRASANGVLQVVGGGLPSLGTRH